MAIFLFFGGFPPVVEFDRKIVLVLKGSIIWSRFLGVPKRLSFFGFFLARRKLLVRVAYVFLLLFVETCYIKPPNSKKIEIKNFHFLCFVFRTHVLLPLSGNVRPLIADLSSFVIPIPRPGNCFGGGFVSCQQASTSGSFLREYLPCTG